MHSLRAGNAEALPDSLQAVVDYFRTGVFDWRPPFGSRIHYIEREKPGCDWIGVNYYGRSISPFGSEGKGLHGC